MARKLRVQYPDAIYHVMNRGDRREPIFKDDEDRRRFLETLDEACGKTGWQIHAYCLMLNHFHLVVETPTANLVAGMKWFLGTYTSRFNRRHKLLGHLFSGRYKTLIVDGSGDGYLRTVCDYVHLNPIRAHLLEREQPLEEYQWSSYAEYLKPPRRRAGWLRVDRLLGELGIGRDDVAGRQHFAEVMEERRGRDQPGEWKAVRRGWFLGGVALRERVLELMGSEVGEHHGGEAKRETDERKAQRSALICNGLGDRLKGAFAVDNTAAGAAQLVRQVRQCAKQREIRSEQVFFGGEDYPSFAENFLRQLRQEKFLVVRVNAWEAKQQRSNFAASSDFRPL